MTKRTELKLEEEIEMLYVQLDVKEAMIKNYTAEIETQRRQLAIAVEALKTIEKKSDKFDDSWGIQEQLDFIKAEAQSRLYQIEELEK